MKSYSKRYKKRLSLFSRFGVFLKRWKLANNRSVEFGRDLLVLGPIPYVKTPKNGRLFLGNGVIINSDSKNSNIALTTRCKFVTGYDGKITVGDNCDLNGTCIVSYDSVSIGDYCQISSNTLISDTDFHPVDIDERRKQMSGESFSLSSVNKRSILIGSNVWIGWGGYNIERL